LRGGRGACFNASPATQKLPHRLRPLHHASHGPPPPLSRGRMKTRNLVLAARLRCAIVTRRDGFASNGREAFHLPPRGRRSAERRMPSTVRTLQCGSVLSGGRSPSGAPPRRSPGRTHPASAQLQFPRFLKPGCIGRYPLPPVSSLPRSAETGRSAGRAVARSRPGADCKSARGLRSRSVFRCASRTRPSPRAG
jgi:hypothetical protein